MCHHHCRLTDPQLVLRILLSLQLIRHQFLPMFRREYQLHCQCRCRRLNPPTYRHHLPSLNRQRSRQAVQPICHHRFRLHVQATPRIRCQAPAPPLSSGRLLSRQQFDRRTLLLRIQIKGHRPFRLTRRPGYHPCFRLWSLPCIQRQALRHAQHNFLRLSPQPRSLLDFQRHFPQ